MLQEGEKASVRQEAALLGRKGLEDVAPADLSSDSVHLRAIQPRGQRAVKAGEVSRKEILHAALKQAQANGFLFRHWFQSHVLPEWPGARRAFALLASEGRHYTLLFSHDFARYFWRSGKPISFVVPATTYPRVDGQGGVVQVTRKPFTRRTNKPDVWKYHLREMAAADDPLAYLCRFLPAHLQAARASHAAAKVSGNAPHPLG